MSSDQALPGEIIPQIASGDPAVSLFGRIGKWLGHAAGLDSFHPPDPSRAGPSGGPALPVPFRRSVGPTQTAGAFSAAHAATPGGARLPDGPPQPNALSFG